MKSTLVMDFKLKNGKTTTISITSPKADLTAAEVNAAANEIVAKDAFIVGCRKAAEKRAAPAGAGAFP